MRKQFVLLVSLFIGLSSGFIAPSSISKIIKNVSSSVLNATVMHEDSSTGNLEMLGKINEKELYQSDDKEKEAKNVNERSFILINKNHRKVFTNHLVKSWMPDFSGTLNVSQLNQKLLQRYTKTQRPEIKHQLVWQQSSHSNDGQNKQSQHNPILSESKDPRPPKIHLPNNASLSGDPIKIKDKNVKKQKPTQVVLSKPIEKIDDKYITPRLKSFQMNSGNNKQSSKYNHLNTNNLHDIPPNIKMRILSYIHRKPNLCLSCSFVKANWLNRMNFAKKIKSDKFKSISIDGNNSGSSIQNLYDDFDDLNIERYMKDTLAEANISDESSSELLHLTEKTLLKDVSDFNDQSNEITENTYTRTSVAVKRKTHTTQYANNVTQVYEDYFETNHVTDVK